jgi:phospholipid/cholesterol/gamma-HCH transport system permease protein
MTTQQAPVPLRAENKVGRPGPRGRLLKEFGDLVYLSWRITRGVPVSVRSYFVEVLRQATILAQGSSLILLVLVFGFGLVIGVESSFGARLVGAPSLAALGPAIAGLRELTPYAFGYMMAAKVSTGYVAEIGTMRITEEIDALDVMGIRSLVYLGSTRVLGTWIVLPLIYGVSVLIGFIGAYLTAVLQIGQVSAGGYLRLFWEFQSPADLIFSGVKGMLMGTFVVLVGIYFGYRVRGGPAEVGIATARAMIVDLVGIHLIGVLTSQSFWGTNPHFPIGG